MADFTLSNGDEITFDLDKLTFGEWQEMKNPAFAGDSENDILVKVSGLSKEQVKSMTMREAKKFYASLIRKVLNPLDEKN